MRGRLALFGLAGVLGIACVSGQAASGVRVRCTAHVQSIKLRFAVPETQSVAPTVSAHVPPGCTGPLVARLSVWRNSVRLPLQAPSVMFNRVPGSGGGVLVEWTWQNWCDGSGSLTIRASVGPARASVESRPPPCGDKRYASEAVPLFVCPGPPAAALPPRHLPWCLAGMRPR